MGQRMAAARGRIKAVGGEVARRHVLTALLVTTALWAMSVVTAPYLASHGAVERRRASRRGRSIPVRQRHLSSARPSDRFMPTVRSGRCVRAARVCICWRHSVSCGRFVTRPPRPQRTSALRVALLAAALPTIVTVFVEAADLYQPTNLVRAVAAMPLGFTTAWLLGCFARGQLSVPSP